MLAARLPRDATARGELEEDVTAVLAVPTERLSTRDVECADVFDEAEVWAAIA